MASYKGIIGKSCKYQDMEATAVSDEVVALMIMDTPFTLSNEQVGHLLEVLGAVTEWRPTDDRP